MDKYPENSPVSNWPKEIKAEYFSIYCSPVSYAIINGLKNKGEKTILKKYLSEDREAITNEEIIVINEAYKNYVEILLMKSGYDF